MTSEKPPTLCAVLINYNHADYLPRALDAALNQTVPFDEVIIIDDASTDDSVRVIEERIHGSPFARLIRNPQNLGVEPTINLGLREARGDYVYLMSADDRYSLDISETCRAALRQYPDAAMVSANIRVHYTRTGKERSFLLPFPQRAARYDRADVAAMAKKRAFTFYGGGNLIRREAILEAGGVLAPFKWYADWFLYFLIACRYPFAVVPVEFICIRQADAQYSHASHQWARQKPVIETLLRTLERDYPDAYGFFRENALLPAYTCRILPLLLRDRALRRYLTPLLAWRLLTYKPMQLAGRLLPGTLRARARTLFRV